TSITGTIIDYAVRSLAGLVDLDVERTKYRGHARELAAAAPGELIIVLGGDGSINEVVNGVMSREADADHGERPPPLIAVIPGGGGNVFARALGLPPDAAAAIRRVRDVIAAGRYRTIGLGLAGDRYFTFNAGLGIDAEVVRAVDGHRARGRTATPALYVRMILRQYYRVTDRRHPALTLERDGQPPLGPLFLGIVSNTAPWTYLGSRPVYTSPHAAFDCGLDVFALRSLRTVSTVRTIYQMLSPSRPPHGGSVLTLH